MTESRFGTYSTDKVIDLIRKTSLNKESKERQKNFNLKRNDTEGLPVTNNMARSSAKWVQRYTILLKLYKI